MPGTDHPSNVLVLSDSTGNLARHMLTAVLTQFPPGSISVRFECFIRTESQLKTLLSEAKAQKAIVCHAMVSGALKKQIKTICAASRLHCFDMTGGFVQFLEKATKLGTTSDVEALHSMDEAYRRRISAMEFTLNHDDGLGLDTLHQADVVLVGVSRTGKTPTSILLAQQGYQAANVSLAHGVQPPSQLFSLASGKVVGLMIDPDQLALIRARRQAAWGMAQTNYGRPEDVHQEIDWSRALFREHSWPVLDVTDQAVEETAAKVISLVGPVAQRNIMENNELPSLIQG